MPIGSLTAGSQPPIKIPTSLPNPNKLVIPYVDWQGGGDGYRSWQIEYNGGSRVDSPGLVMSTTVFTAIIERLNAIENYLGITNQWNDENYYGS